MTRMSQRLRPATRRIQRTDRISAMEAIAVAELHEALEDLRSGWLPWKARRVHIARRLVNEVRGARVWR